MQVFRVMGNKTFPSEINEIITIFSFKIALALFFKKDKYKFLTLRIVQLRRTGSASADVATRTAALLVRQRPATSELRSPPYDKSSTNALTLFVFPLSIRCTQVHTSLNGRLRFSYENGL